MLNGILGGLIVLCVVLIGLLLFTYKGILFETDKINGQYTSILGQYNTIVSSMGGLSAQIRALPPSVQNVIHLGLQESKITTGMTPVSIPINPDDFKIETDTLREKLLEGLKTKKKDFEEDIPTYAFVILNHAGLMKIMDANSRRESEEALIRLLLNGNVDATKRFLEALAESVCQAQFTSVAQQTAD